MKPVDKTEKNERSHKKSVDVWVYFKDKQTSHNMHKHEHYTV